MSRRLRVAGVVLFLGIAGFLLGVAAFGGGGAVGLLLRPSDIGGALLGIQAVAGGMLGAIVLPMIAMAALRGVPLWRVLLGPALGAAVGSGAEWALFSRGDWHGAAVGAFVAVAALLIGGRASRRRSAAPSLTGRPARDNVSLSAGPGGEGVGTPDARVRSWLTRR